MVFRIHVFHLKGLTDISVSKITDEIVSFKNDTDFVNVCVHISSHPR